MRAGAKFIAWVVGFGPVLALAATNTLQVFNTDFGTNVGTHTDLTIAPGDTVQWIWVDGFHSVTASSGQSEIWNSGNHFAPFTNSHTFTQLGTYNYFCSIHGSELTCGGASGMQGHIFVVLPGVTPLQITSITQEGADVRVQWVTGNIFCKTNALQRASGALDGSFTNDFSDIFLVTNAVSVVTNFLDAGAVTNSAVRYYRVRQVP